MLSYNIMMQYGLIVTVYSSLRLVVLALAALAASVTGHAGAPPQVVASITPLHSLVAGVMQGVAAPQLLLRGGETPHSFSLRPSDARKLHHADVVFWVGAGLERPLQHVLASLSGTRSVSMLDTPGLETLPMRSMHSHGHDEADARHRTDAAVDPHIWLSLRNAMAMTDEIARVLSRTDPSNAQRYRANAAAQRRRLQALHDELQDRLDGLSAAFAVFHDAYQYLEHAFGLQSTATVTTHPERRPGAAHLHELRKTLKNRQVRCLFSEPQFDARLLSRLSEGLPIRHAVLDPLGADVTPGPDAYARLMQGLATTLHACLYKEPRQ